MNKTFKNITKSANAYGKKIFGKKNWKKAKALGKDVESKVFPAVLIPATKSFANGISNGCYDEFQHPDELYFYVPSDGEELSQKESERNQKILQMITKKCCNFLAVLFAEDKDAILSYVSYDDGFQASVKSLERMINTGIIGRFSVEEVCAMVNSEVIGFAVKPEMQRELTEKYGLI